MKPEKGERTMKREHKSAGAAVANSIPTAPPTILTVEQVAARLQIPKSSIYEKTRFRGAQASVPMLPHRRVGKYLRFVAAEVDAWFLALPASTRLNRRGYHKHAAAA
jgi:predicted DNA-binding transcriptional regulator AlpA